MHGVHGWSADVAVLERVGLGWDDVAFHGLDLGVLAQWDVEVACLEVFEALAVRFQLPGYLAGVIIPFLG